MAQAQLQDRDASHEAAIFGRGASHGADEGPAILGGHAGEAAAAVVGDGAGEEEEQPAVVVVEEQSEDRGPQLGWRERAALLKAHRAKAGV